ncbi:MAG TPA: hypothetical protein VH165_00280 [Kofleriaceae bacterium]|jgi:hypothetical protein|nr:hypothetical protein [Kofleriaceae bacterium]
MISTPHLLSVTLLLLAGACGGGSSAGGGALTGAVHGQSIMIDDVISAAVTTTVAGVSIHAAAIFMATSKDLCSDAMSNTEHPNEKASVILLTDINGTTFNTPTATGTYAIFQGSGTPPAKSAFFNVLVEDATCKDVTAQEAAGTSGTVTLTSFSGNQFSGNFDLVLDSGDHVTGSFDPSECPALSTVVNNSMTSTCI